MGQTFETKPNKVHTACMSPANYSGKMWPYSDSRVCLRSTMPPEQDFKNDHDLHDLYMVYHTDPHKNNLNDVNKSEYYANMCIVSFWKNNFPKFYFNQGINIMKFTVYTLAGRVSWLEHCPVDQRVAGLIPSQDTYLGCRLCPSLGHMQGRTANWHSLASMFLSLSL